MGNRTLDLPDLNNGLNNDNNGDDDSSSGSSMILELLMCHNEPISNSLEIHKDWRGLDDPLAQFKRVFDETLFVSEIPKATDIEVAIAITPCEVKQLVSLLGDEFCEELAHWKKFLHEVLAMVKQLRMPTFFLTISYADSRWNELTLII